MVKYEGGCPDCGYAYPEFDHHRDLEWDNDGMTMWYPEYCPACGATYTVEFVVSGVIPYNEYDGEGE